MRRQVALVIAGTGVALAALSSAAFAQSYACRDTETQPECHTRLRCKSDEDLETCQQRLRSQASDRGGDDRGDGGDDSDRGNDDRSDRGRSRSDDGGGRDRARGSDRGGRDDRSRSRGRRGGGGGRGRGRDGGGGGSHRFVANKTFGIGLELGEPSGLNGKYFASPNVALDFGLGAIYSHYYYGDGVHLYGDVLFHPVSLASNPSFELPFYVGVGLRYWEFDYCYMDLCTYDGATFGIRIPFGLAVDFNSAPLDLFFQLVPVIDFVDEDYYDRFGNRRHTGIDASLGLRFWFN
ncbi:MAG TPA: hypothetical protein VM261_30045 [Kofleriaceae bacterium]|nr:hypothetical protein [Kofleriaceae bacterium]